MSLIISLNLACRGSVVKFPSQYRKTLEGNHWIFFFKEKKQSNRLWGGECQSIKRNMNKPNSHTQQTSFVCFKAKRCVLSEKIDLQYEYDEYKTIKKQKQMTDNMNIISCVIMLCMFALAMRTDSKPLTCVHRQVILLESQLLLLL